MHLIGGLIASVVALFCAGSRHLHGHPAPDLHGHRAPADVPERALADARASDVAADRHKLDGQRGRQALHLPRGHVTREQASPVLLCGVLRPRLLSLLCPVLERMLPEGCGSKRDRGGDWLGASRWRRRLRQLHELLSIPTWVVRAAVGTMVEERPVVFRMELELVLGAVVLGYAKPGLLGCCDWPIFLALLKAVVNASVFSTPPSRTSRWKKNGY